METTLTDTQSWIQERIKQDEIVKYLRGGKDFIDEAVLQNTLRKTKNPDKIKVDAILEKALSLSTLEAEDTATLLNVTDGELWNKIFTVAAQIKRKVYDRRIVTFAPLYTGNMCVNDCLYCGFRCGNTVTERRVLTIDEIKKETEILVGTIGHKRLIVVYGEHPQTDIEYMINSIRAIYSVTVQKGGHDLYIRRVNVNASPLPIEHLKEIKSLGIGVYQVFQETYHKKTYTHIHPKETIKGSYLWRLYCMHRAIESGLEDVGIGALFGLYDWKFEVMGLLYHARELERVFGFGPHTISIPRLEPAVNTPFLQDRKYHVHDEDFKKLVAVLRISIPYAGLILTARESALLRREVVGIGCTQMDASTRIGIGAYSETACEQISERQQFMLGDTRSLDEIVGELADRGSITSFCTAGYRCGRTGKHIMDSLKTGTEAMYCKMNAILTFREWLNDFASPATKQKGELLLHKEIHDLKLKYPNEYDECMGYYQQIMQGKRDIYF